MDDQKPIQRAIVAAGGQAAVATALEVSQGMVWQWFHLRRPIAARHCRKLSDLGGGVVSVCALLPDVFGPEPSPAPSQPIGQRDGVAA